LTRPGFAIILRTPLDGDASSIVARRPRFPRISTMPKMKTKKAAAKRFRVTGSGRVRRPKAGGNHGMQEKSRKRLRRLRQNDMVDKSMQKRAKRMLPYG
jgi:large subunit ribosomal protein L35